MFSSAKNIYQIRISFILHNRKSNKKESDIPGFYKDGKYSKLYSFSTPRQHAVRVVLNEDLIFRIQKKFFCDRPCEKKVKFKVAINFYHIDL